ncbi:MAG: nickel pincer cofactor biosynthesis protein LarB, partial [bacterium]
MNRETVQEVLEKVKAGALDVDEALEHLRSLPFEEMGFATIDHHRALRRGFPEVIFCQGKRVDQIVSIAERITSSGSDLLATRASREVYEAVRERVPNVEYNELARTITLIRGRGRAAGAKTRGTLLVISAGTSDVPVAEEAAVTAEVLGNRVERIFDVGVAGIHRLFAHREKIEAASVIIVVAGMEGALASVVGGLVDKPVIAVPTSVGYGASFQGLAALLGMLNSCTAGVTVVNIDNGFGAGYA